MERESVGEGRALDPATARRGMDRWAGLGRGGGGWTTAKLPMAQA